MNAPAPPPEYPEVAAALRRLVERGVLDPAQAGAVAAELWPVWPAGGGAAAPDDDSAAVPAGLRRRFAEIAGYLGGAFVVGATFLFLGQEWDKLGRGGRFGVLAAMAVVLFASGVVVRVWGGRALDDVRRRLASTLMTGAAGAAGFAAFVMLEPAPTQYDYGARVTNLAPLGASVVGLIVVLVGYLLARSAVGHLGTALAALMVIYSVLDLAHTQGGQPFGLGTLLLGVGWAVLVWLRVLPERRFGVAVAVTLALVGAQFAIDGQGGRQYVGYVLTAVVAAACFAAYTRLRDWVLLAGGVVGTTLVVPEFLDDVTNGSLGASGAMLVAGVTLLGASLAGMRLRKEAEEPDVTGRSAAVR